MEPLRQSVLVAAAAGVGWRVLTILFRRWTAWPKLRDISILEVKRRFWSATKTGPFPTPASLDFSAVVPVDSDYDWQNAAPRPYRPWHDGPHYVTMGLKKTTLQDWVEIDDQYKSRHKYKQTLFASHPDDTIQAAPGTFDASLEALWNLADFLPRRYPSMFYRPNEYSIQNLITAETWDLRKEADTWTSYHPLQVMGLLTTEDWFIMQTDEDGQTTRLQAGANCFPAGWRLRERIGHSLWQIHAGRVPQYEQKLSVGMDRFFLRLSPDKPFMRFNYAIDISSELFHINSHHNLKAENLEDPVTLEHLHLRVERQVLQRLPKSQAIIFSIRTYITPITEVTKDTAVARALRTSVNSYTPDLAAYKNKALWESVLEKHLEQVLDDNVRDGNTD